MGSYLLGLYLFIVTIRSIQETGRFLLEVIDRCGDVVEREFPGNDQLQLKYVMEITITLADFINEIESHINEPFELQFTLTPGKMRMKLYPSSFERGFYMEIPLTLY